MMRRERLAQAGRSKKSGRYSEPYILARSGRTGRETCEADENPEATILVAHRNASGIAEAIRPASMAVTPRAMLYRVVSVIQGRTLIAHLLGSPKACMESMDDFLDTIPHSLALLRGAVSDCARSQG